MTNSKPRALNIVKSGQSALKGDTAMAVIVGNSYLGAGQITEDENDSLYLTNKWVYTCR